MAGPFPGMNPFLERYWRDIHASLIIYSRDQLQPQLPRDLRARVEERVFVQSPEGLVRGVYPDVRVIEPRTSPSRRGGGTVVAEPLQEPSTEPLVLYTRSEPAVETFIQIIDVGSGGRVVTVIEFLSAANKTGEGWKEYRQKQRELMTGGVSLVEVDLLRGGEHTVSVPIEAIPPGALTTYRACVWRAWKPGQHEFYPVSLREPLPTLRVPLREEDDDVLLGLQSLIDRCYDNGGYDDLDYSVPLDPPLVPEEATWVEDLLRRAETSEQD